MVTLYCAVVGVAGSAFPVDIDPTLSVGHLKKAIKDKQKNGLKDVDADKLLLFLAEKKACGWLDEDEAAAVSFDANGHPEGFKLMKPSWFLENPEYFGATFQPGQGQIHVLVVVPVCGAKDDAWSAKELSTLDPDIQSRVWKVVKVSSPDVCSGTALVVDQTPTHLYLLTSLHLWTDSTFTDSLSPAFQNEIKAYLNANPRMKTSGRKRKEPDVKDAKVAPRKYSRTAARNATALSDKPEVVVEQLFPDMTKPGEVYRFRLDSDVCWRSSSVFNFAIFAVPMPEDHTNLSPCKMFPLLNVGMSVSVFGFPGTPEDHGHAYTIAPAKTTGWSRNQVILASLAAPGLPGSAIVYNKAGVALGYILGGREGPASMNEQHAYSYIGVIPVLPSSS